MGEMKETGNRAGEMRWGAGAGRRMTVKRKEGEGRRDEGGGTREDWKGMIT